MKIELNDAERNTLLGGPVSAAMAVMSVDLGIVSCAKEALAMGRELAEASKRYADNPLIAGLFDPEAIKKGIRPDKLEVTPDDVRAGKVLDKALVEVDQAMELARAKTDDAGARQFANLIVGCCEAVAQAAGKGLFGSGEKVSEGEKAALAKVRSHLGLAA
jgi:hypothetical protein